MPQEPLASSNLHRDTTTDPQLQEHGFLGSSWIVVYCLYGAKVRLSDAVFVRSSLGLFTRVTTSTKLRLGDDRVNNDSREEIRENSRVR